MIRVYIAILLLTLFTTSAFAGASDGFVSLFNGKNLDGWVVGGKAEGFKVVDGCMFSEGGKGGDWIRTEKMYGNFIFRLEWMLSKTGNSGILIRFGVPSPGFMEAQLLAPWTPYRDDLHCTGSLYGHVPANPRPDETTLRWRKAEIRAQWKTISVYIDGVKTCKANYDTVPTMKGFPMAGYVGMQDSHTGEGEWVKFRNIEIKDLDQDPVFVTKGMASSDLEIRKAAYDSALRLGPSMVAPLLDLLARAQGAQAHDVEMALEAIVNRSSAPEAKTQADEVRMILTKRLASISGTGTKDQIHAAKMLGIIGQGDKQTLEVLSRACLAGGSLSDAAIESMQRIPGKQVTDALTELLKKAAEPEDRLRLKLAIEARGTL